MNFPIGIKLYPQVKYWGHMSPASLGRFYCLRTGWGIQSMGINSPTTGVYAKHAFVNDCYASDVS